MKRLAIFMLLLGFMAMSFGCASWKKYGFWNIGADTAARLETKVEVAVFNDKDGSLKAKELSVVEVVAAPDADPAPVETALEAMKKNIFEEFEREGWVFNEDAPLKLNIILSKCDRKEIVGKVLFKKEEDTVANLLVTLMRSKKLAAWHATSTYATENQFRMIFAIGIIQAINRQN